MNKEGRVHKNRHIKFIQGRGDMFKEFLFVLISVSLVSSRSLTKSEWLDINRLLEIAAIRKAGQLNYGADDNLLRSNNELQYDDDEYDRYENEPKAFNVVDHLVDPSSAFEPLSRQVRYSEDKDRYEAAIKAMDKTNKDYLQALQGGNNKPFKDLFSSERWRCLLGLSYVFGLMLFSGFLDRVGSEQCSMRTSSRGPLHLYM